jgi:hypothetical protein
MEEVRKQLDQLHVFTAYPQLVEEHATLKKQLDDVTRELASYQAVERVEQRAQHRFNAVKLAWETDERPRAVRRVALALVEMVVTILRRPPPRYFPSDVIEFEIVTVIQELLNNEVQSRLDRAFQDRVDAAARRRTAEQLDAARREAWPRWVATHVEPRIRQLETAIESNVVDTLRGPWRITCQACGVTDPMELTPSGIDTLLRTGQLVIPCENPPCRGRSRRTLRELLESRLPSYASTEP